MCAIDLQKCISPRDNVFFIFLVECTIHDKEAARILGIISSINNFKLALQSIQPPSGVYELWMINTCRANPSQRPGRTEEWSFARLSLKTFQYCVWWAFSWPVRNSRARWPALVWLGDGQGRLGTDGKLCICGRYFANVLWLLTGVVGMLSVGSLEASMLKRCGKWSFR